MGDGLNFSRLADGFVVFQTALRIDKMGSEDGIDESAFSEPSLANHNDVELETPLEQLVLNLAGDGVETDIGRGTDFFDSSSSHCL